MFEQIDKYILAEMEKMEIPSLSVAIAKDQNIIWSRGYGYSNLEEKTPATDNTIYRVASMTKPVISTGLLQWLEKGRFQLDDLVNDHFEKVKIQTEFDEQPTMRNLLTHTSGLPSHVPPIYYDESEAISLKELITRYAKVTLPPNRAWVYSNTAFAIIGYLIGLFASQPYPHYMKENVLEPLDMNASSFESTPSIKKSMAQGYERIEPSESIEAVKPYFLGCLPENACGCLYTTVIDYAHFLIAHMNRGVYKGQRILEEETISEMHKLQWAAGNSRNGSGLPWARGWHHGHLALSHGGGMPGWVTQGIMYPDLKLAIVIFSNLSGGPNWRNLFTGAILRMLLGEYQPFNPETIRVETVPGHWHKLAGTYVSDHGSYQHGKKSEVTIKEGYLILEMADEEIYLEELDEARYLIHGGASNGQELTFEYDEQGRAKQFDLGTSIYPRYVKEELPIVESADLVGSWHGEYMHFYGPYTIDLEIESATRATATDMGGRKIPVADFKVDLGRVIGTLKLTAPREYVGWEAWCGSHVKLKLAAIDDQLKGHMIMERPALWKGTMIPFSLSRS
ncbi:MAG: serine hydrolase [Desulfobacterales bacterium]|nr:serine hydrolase [Desulfobacterales bacterium]